MLRRVFTVISVLGVLVLVGVAALIFYATSEAGLPLVLQQVQRLTQGRLQVTGATGSLLSTFRAQELRWQGPTTTVIAHDVSVTWSPTELAQRRLHVRTLGAASIDVLLAPNASSTTELPASLGLPLSVSIDHATVSTLDFTVGARSGRISGLAFAYAGDAQQHRLSSLLLAFEQGHIAGDVTLQAAKPFATQGHIAFTGEGPLAGVALDTAIAGPLANLIVTASGHADAAELTAKVELTPFAPTPLAHLDLDARNVNAARLVAGLPDTALVVRAEARPATGGFAGTLAITNATAGSLDTQRLPITQLTTAFAQTADSFTLTMLDAALSGGGHARGSGRIALTAGNASTWALTLDDVDLHAVHGRLVPTRINGRVDATVDKAAQRFNGTLADRGRGLQLAFDATVAQRTLTLARARLASAAGTVEGSGQLAFDGAQGFAFKGKATHFNPAELGRFPAASLDGDVALTGNVAPAWKADIDVALAPTSTLSGLRAHATGRATLSAQAVTDVRIDAGLGAASLQLTGATGTPNAVLHYQLDVPKLADVAPLLPRGLPHPLQGALSAEGDLRLGAGGIANAGATLHAHAEKLVAGEWSMQTARVEASFAPGSGDASDRHWTQRAVALTATLEGVGGLVPVRTASAELKGSLGAHTLTLALTRGNDAITLAAKGGVSGGAGTKAASEVADLHWNGSLDRLDATGAIALALTAPAALDASREQVRVTHAALIVDKGHFTVDQFAWAQGRITTAGSFSGVPLATVAQLAGVATPLASTLTLGGAWSIAAAPRLNGTFSVQREGGDLYASEPDDAAAPDYSLGTTALALKGTFTNDALALAGEFDSVRAGHATLALDVAAGAIPGHLASTTPTHIAVRADLASLRPLQPWLGTSAVIDGRAQLDVTATGTLHALAWTGTLDADSLRLDSPQWGLQLSDGRVRARLADHGIQLDEFSVHGGDGSLTAQGLLARSSTEAGASTEIKWRAQHFRVLNRPDRRIVMNGSGTASEHQGKLTLAGNIQVEQGHFAYEPMAPLLGDDVVVKGRPRPAPADDRLRTTSTTLDLSVDLGNQLTFEGEGLDTRLTGKVHVTTGSDGLLYGNGTIRAVNGTYYAFGQRLSIERGQLIFDGPLDNPALDVVALRRNLAVEAGVELTGTVKVPRVQLTSNPPVPDGEKLAWLVTGQPPGRGGAADATALAAASASFLGGGGKPLGTQLAERLGLDDISLQSSDLAPTAPGATPASGQVLALGKRINDRLSLVYQQGLTVASNALRLEYRLNRSVTLQAEAGLVSGIGLVFRRSYN